MSRDWRLYWDDLVAGCEKVLRYTEGMDYDGFREDQKTYDAVLHPTRLEVVFGCLRYEAPGKTLQEMEQAIAEEVRRRHAGGLY